MLDCKKKAFLGRSLKKNGAQDLNNPAGSMQPVQTKISRHILCSLIMVCTVCYSVSTYFEIYPKNDKWFCPD
jgi:hypothetical protein